MFTYTCTCHVYMGMSIPWITILILDHSVYGRLLSFSFAVQVFEAMSGHGFVPTKDTHARMRALLRTTNGRDAAVQYFRLFGTSMTSPLKWLESFARHYASKREFSLISEVRPGCERGRGRLCVVCVMFWGVRVSLLYLLFP